MFPARTSMHLKNIPCEYAFLTSIGEYPKSPSNYLRGMVDHAIVASIVEKLPLLEIFFLEYTDRITTPSAVLPRSGYQAGISHHRRGVPRCWVFCWLWCLSRIKVDASRAAFPAHKQPRTYICFFWLPLWNVFPANWWSGALVQHYWLLISHARRLGRKSVSCIIPRWRVAFIWLRRCIWCIIDMFEIHLFINCNKLLHTILQASGSRLLRFASIRICFLFYINAQLFVIS
jgi:hypothetical protein